MCYLNYAKKFLFLAAVILCAMLVWDGMPANAALKKMPGEHLDLSAMKNADDDQIDEDDFIDMLNEAFEKMEEHGFSDADKILDPIAAKGKKLIPMLKKIMKDENDLEAKVIAAAVLIRLGDNSELPLLIEMLRDDDLFENAAGALYAAGGKEVIDALLKELKGNNNFARRGAMLALGVLRAQEALPDILALLKTEPKGPDQDLDLEMIELYEAASFALINMGKPALKGLKEIFCSNNLLSKGMLLKNMATILSNPEGGDIRETYMEALISSLGQQKEKEILEAMAMVLERLTKLDFGVDAAKWQQWWKENKEPFLKKLDEKVKKRFEDDNPDDEEFEDEDDEEDGE